MKKPLNKEIKVLQDDLESIFNAIPDLLFEVGLDGRYYMVRSPRTDLMADTPSNMLGKTVFDILPHHAAKVCIEALSEANEKGFSQGKSFELLLDGNTKWFELSISRKRGTYKDGPHFIVLSRDITERNINQTKLIESEERFRKLWYDIPSVSVQGYKMDGTTSYWNKASERIYGYTQEEALGKNLLDLIIPPVMREDVKNAMAHMVQTNIAIPPAELKLLRKDGSFVDVLSSHGIVKTYNNEAELFCLDIDISSQKEIQKAFAQSKERFKALHNASFGGIALHDKGLILECNEGLSKLFGYSEDELIGMDGMLLIAKKYRNAVMQHILEGYEKPYEAYGRHKDGREFPVRLEGREIPYKDKRIRVVEFRDISEDKKAQEKLLLAANVFTHTHEGILITDRSGIIIDANTAFLETTGYAREEVIGQTPRILKSDLYDEKHYAHMWKTLYEQGYWHGEMWNKRKNGEVFPEMVTVSSVKGVEGNIQYFVAHFTDISFLKEHEKQLEYMAHYDSLTQLPNRVLLADRLKQSMINTQRHKQFLAIGYIDLDGFKEVNDTHGHNTGDKLLIALSARMKETLREGDTLSRFGGDEFVVTLVDLKDEEDCHKAIERLLEEASRTVYIDDKALQISASIGITLYPQDNVDADMLIRHADQAMYQAKQAGKNRYHLFDIQQDIASKLQNEHIEQIRLALKNEEFVLHYQPKVNMQTGEVIGVEALIRWEHSKQGLLYPASFLPKIENHSISVDVGAWVIECALKQIVLWQAQKIEMPISVNVGAKQLQQDDFVSILHTLLQKYPSVKAGLLELEILETSALEDVVQTAEVMVACRNMGVHFAIDDFGTGYSSLTYLKRLPAKVLKIDQSFIRDMLNDEDDLSIVKGIIGLATTFHRQVIAEGVESFEHAKSLLSLGCEMAQGYGIAKPMPSSDISAWLETWHRDKIWQTLRQR